MSNSLYFVVVMVLLKFIGLAAVGAVVFLVIYGLIKSISGMFG